MKKYETFLLYAVVGILLIVGPHTIFRVCSTETMIMKCHYATVAVGGAATFLTVTGLLSLWARTSGERIRLHILAIWDAVITILFPAVWIGGCDDPEMACKSLTFPSIYLLSAVVAVYSVIRILLERKAVEK